MIERDLQCNGVPYHACVPDERFAPPFPLVILLHGAGAGDDHNAWLNWGGLEQTAENYPLVVVTPRGILRPAGRSLGCPEVRSDLLASHLPSAVTAALPGLVREGRWGIGGLSYGAYTAIRLAFAHADRCGSVWGHSGFYDDDVFEAVSTCPRDRRAALEVGLDCGLDDPLLGSGRRLKAHLNSLGLSPEYCERPGRHDWGYWRHALPAALAQHARVLYYHDRVR